METSSKQEAVVAKPYIGQEFDNEESAYEFYRSYALREGFCIRKDYFHKNRRTGKVTCRKFVCSKEGFKQIGKQQGKDLLQRLDTRCGCKAGMRISSESTKTKFVVATFVEEHNHLLHLAECVQMLPIVRNVNEVHDSQMDINTNSELMVKQLHEFMTRKISEGEHLGYKVHDRKRFLQTRQHEMRKGDKAYLVEYFSQQLLDSPSFYYALQLGAADHITNVFWADARMIIDYSKFGDVITFDTTYKTNKNSRPLGVFGGLNNYKQIVIFGAALLYDETVESFEWLFGTFLRAMSHQAPKTIFTDQDATIGKALKNIWPNTYHALCTFHVSRNMKNMASVLREKFQQFESDFCKIMFEYGDEEKFDDAWNEMLQKYHLEANSWVKEIYELRQKWAWAFMKKVYTLGIRSAQIDESMNSELKSYLRTDLHLAELLKQFNKVVEEKRYKELEAECKARQKIVEQGIRKCPMLSQTANVYTPVMHREFSEQYIESLGLVVKEKTIESDGVTVMFKVSSFDHDDSEIVIARPSDGTVRCLCMYMETRGILCSHALKVLDALDIKRLPEKYILVRWTRTARCLLEMSSMMTDESIDPKVAMAERYKMLCLKMVKVASRAAENSATTKYVNEMIEDLGKNVEALMVTEGVINSSYDCVVKDRNKPPGDHNQPRASLVRASKRKWM